jgi:hypothetical protein
MRQKRTKRSVQPNPIVPAVQSSNSYPTRSAVTDKIRLVFGRMIGWLGSNLGWLSVLITLASAFFFLPRVTIEPSGPYDPSNPSPILFTIANANIIPLRNVEVGIGLCYVVPQDGGPTPLDCNGPAQSVLVFTPWSVKWLDVDEKYEIAIEDALRRRGKEQIEKADITIKVIYTPWRLPFWRSQKEFRFVTKRRSDGKIYWTAVPLNR